MIRPTHGKTIKFFFLTSAGIRFLKRNRLLSKAMRALKYGITRAKHDLAKFIHTYWARDTSEMINSAIRLLFKNVYNNPRRMFRIAIGSNVDYAKYVYKMMDVHWTNPKTFYIQGKFIESTTEKARQLLLRRIRS